jgi:5-methylcytosine-specific restriction endonuclease McrA
MAISKEAADKLAESMRERWRDPAWRAMMSERVRASNRRRRGIPKSEETKAKISATLMGHEFDEETKSKIAQTLRRQGVPDGVEVPEGMKYCRGCGRVLSLDSFQKAKRTRDKRQSRCRECRNGRARAQNNPALTTGEKECSKCGRTLPVSEFHRNKSNKDGLMSWCKECNRVHSTAWNQENAEYKRQYQSQWQRDNPDLANARNHRYRARLLAAPGDGWTPEQWQAVLDHYAPDGKCLACGKKRKLTVDHVVMLQDGGANDISNVQPLCRRCNSRRESMDYRPDAGAYAQSLVRER